MENGENKSITLDDLSAMIKEGFDGVDKRFEDVDKRFEGIETRMATKEDLQALATKEDLGKLRSDLIDYIAKQNMHLKGDLVVLLRGEDKKLFALVELLVKKSLLSREEAQQVTKLEPFPQAM